MSYELVCEDFELTDAIGNHIAEISARIAEGWAKPVYPHFFLSRCARKLYTAGVRVRFFERDLYAESTHRDLYEASLQAGKMLKKQMIEINRQKHAHHHARAV